MWLSLSPWGRASLSSGQPSPPVATSGKMHIIPRGHSQPSRTVTAQRQSKENSPRVCFLFYTRKGVFTSTHTHTHCWPWLVQLQTKNRKFPLIPSPPYSEGSQGCAKETPLSKIIYEDRFLCIRDQSSESREQLRHPSAAQGGKKHPSKPT